MISSWVRKVLSIAKAHMSLGTFVALVAGISLVSILQEGDWVRVFISARHYFSAYTATIDPNQDSVQCTFLGLSE